MSFGLFGTARNMSGNLGQLGAYALGSLSRRPDFGIQHPPRYFGPPINLNNLTPPAISANLNQNAQQITKNHKELIDRLDKMLDKAEIPYDDALAYMKDLEKHISEMKKQQEAEEKEILDKKLKELKEASGSEESQKLEDKYKKYQDEQKSIESKKKQLTELEKNKEPLQHRQMLGAEIKQAEKENRQRLEEIYKDYDKAVSSKIDDKDTNQETKDKLKKSRDAMRYIYERRKQIEELDKDFETIKKEYFIDPQTEDWSKTKIKDGYTKALREAIQPRMKDLEYGFDRDRIWHQAEDGLGVLSETGEKILKDLKTRYYNNPNVINNTEIR